MKCMACGRPIADDAKFCLHCGRPAGGNAEPIKPSAAMKNNGFNRKVLLAAIVVVVIVAGLFIGYLAMYNLLSSSALVRVEVFSDDWASYRVYFDNTLVKTGRITSSSFAGTFYCDEFLHTYRWFSSSPKEVEVSGTSHYSDGTVRFDAILLSLSDNDYRRVTLHL